MLSSFITRLVLSLGRHRPAALGGAAALFLLSLLLTSRIRLDPDVRMMLPQDDETIASYYETLSKFRPMDRMYVDVGTARPDPRALADAADALHDRLRALPGLRGITYAIDLEGARASFDLLAARIPGLFSEEDARALEARLEPEAIRERLAWFKRNLAGPQGLFLKEVVRRDPVGMTDLLVAKAAPLQAGFGGARVEDGRITSGDGQHVLLLVEAAFPPADSDRSAAFVEGVRRAARETEAERAAAGVTVAFTGAHRSSHDNVSLVTEDATRTTLLAAAACLVLTLLFFHRWWLGFLVLVPLGFGCAMAGAVVSLAHVRVSAIAVGCGAALVGIAIDYGTHVLFHLDVTEPGDRRREAERVGFLAMPIAIGVLTTAGAFFLFFLSPIPGYRQIGLFSAVAVLLAAAFSLVVLPLLVPRSRRGGNPVARAGVRLCERFFAWHGRHTAALGIVALALAAAAAFGLGRVTFDGDPQALNGMTEEARRDERRMQATWGDALALTLVVTEAPTLDAALHQDARVAGVLRDLRERGVVSSFSSVSSLCPSRDDQAENARRWKAFWTPERRAEADRRVAEAAAALGFRAGAFDAWSRALAEEPPPLGPDDFDGTPVRRALDDRIAAGPAGTAVSAVVKLRNRDDADRLGEAVRAAAPGAVVIDAKAVASRITGLAKDGLSRYAVLAAGVVVAVLFLVFGRAGLVLVSILPVGVAMVWTFGVLGLIGLPINLASSAFVVFLIGVGIDTSQFLVAERLARFRGGTGHLGDTAASVALCALTTLVGFGALALARHPVLASVGVTSSIGIASILVAVPVFTPLAADVVLRRDRTGGAPRLVDLAGGLWATLYLAVAQFLLLFVAAPVLVLLHPRSPERRRAGLRRLSRGGMRGLLAVFPHLKKRWESTVPDLFHPPAIVVSNHQSNVDIPFLMSIPADIRFTVKKRWWDTLMIGFAVRTLGHVLADPRDPQATLEGCRRALDEGACVHFFPEATRSPDGFFLKFHRGAFRLAVELKRDILPVVICDSWECLHPGGWWIEGAHVRVRAYPRITPQTFDYAAGPVVLMKHVESVLAASFQEQLDRNNTPAVLRKKVGRLYRYQGPFVEQYVFWKLRTDPLFAAIDGAVPRRGRILDLGCGYGIVAHWLFHHGDGREIRGIDYDEAKIRVARSTAEGRRRIAFETGDALAGDLPGADAVLLLDVLHYAPPARQRELLARVRRALSPGGRLVIRDMFREASAGHRRCAFWERFAMRLGLNKAPEGLHDVTLEEMHAMLREAGFVRVEEVAKAGRGSNRMLVAWREPADHADQTE